MTVAPMVVIALAVTAAATSTTIVVVVSVSAASVIAVVTSAYTGRFAHVNARCGCVRALGDREIDAYATTIDLHTGALILCNLGVFLVHEVYEAKTTRTAGLGINNDLYFINWSKFGENLIDLLFSGI